jgi:hypothetical protein
LLHPHEKQLTLDDLVEILRQSALEEGEELEPESEKWAMMVMNITMFQGTDWKSS